MSILPMMNHNPFINNEKYKVEVDPIGDYIATAVNFFENYHGLSHQESVDKIVALVKEKGSDPRVTVYKRKKNGDKIKTMMKLTQYISEAYRLNECLVPSLTRYSPSEEDGGEDSLHKSFTMYNLANRSKAKKGAATAYAEGDMWLCSELTNKQKVLKLLNNAMSGAFASPGTIHYNPSAHYTLTSITRSVASIGNIVTEMVSGGTRFYKDLDHTLQHLISTVVGVPNDKYEMLIRKENIHVPTVDEVMETIAYSSDLYWTYRKWTNIIHKYVSNLTDVERCKIVYNNDFFHFYKYNVGYTKRMILTLGKKRARLVPVEMQAEYIDQQTDYVRSLAIHICMDEMRGMELNTKKLQEKYDSEGKALPTALIEAGDLAMDVVSSTMVSINDALFEYEHVLNTLFANRIHPVGIGNTKDMVRRVIALSDTDSTCGSYNHWVQLVLGGDDYTSRGVQVSATVMTIVGLSIENAINCFTGNMNVGTKSAGLLEMKNEYFWKTFAVGNGTKHYYAMVNIREGLVLREPELELKGSQFIRSKTGKEYRDHADRMFKDVNATITNAEYVDVEEMVRRTLDVEKSIVEKITTGDLSIMESTTIKEKRSYKKPESSPYQHYNLWNEVFAEKYGSIDEPPYIALKYNCTIKKKSSLMKYLDGIKDDGIRTRFRVYFEKYGKDKITNILLPFDIVLSKGIPEEILDIVDTTTIIRNNCGGMYRILASVGVDVKKESTLLSMGYE